MRIAFFGLQSAFDYHHIGGSESLTRRLAKQLTQDNDVEAVDYVLFHAPCTDDRVVLPKVHVRYFSTYSDAAKALLEGYDHVVSLHLSRAERIAYAAFRARYGHRLMFHAFRTTWPRSLAKRLLMFADLQLVPLNGCAFAISPRLYALMKRWARRPFLMLPVVPDDWFLTAANKPIHSPLRVTFIGRIDPGKGAREVAELCHRLKYNTSVACRVYGYHFGYQSEEEKKIYRRLKELPAGMFIESNYTSCSPQLDNMIQEVLSETDILLLPYRDVSSTTDMPLLFMEGMASLCALILPPSAADLPLVYGPSKFYIRGEDWVESMLEIISSAGTMLDEERRRSEARNAQLNFGVAASAQAFKRALLGQQQPRQADWPKNFLTYKQVWP